MRRVRIVPYNGNSASVKHIKEGLKAYKVNALLLLSENSQYVYKKGDVIINWGCTRWGHDIPDEAIINKPEAVELAVNKIKCFDKLSEYDVNIPEYTQIVEEANQWLQEDAIVLGRRRIKGYGGEGIDIYKPDEQQRVNYAPLYVKYKKKRSEYRVHVFPGVGHLVARKVFKPSIIGLPEGSLPPQWYIRNHNNGFCFQYHFMDENGNKRLENERAPLCVIHQASIATSALGLDFGAVDVIYNEKEDRAYVLEVNTAPGIEIASVPEQLYVEEFLRLAREE